MLVSWEVGRGGTQKKPSAELAGGFVLEENFSFLSKKRITRQKGGRIFDKE